MWRTPARGHIYGAVEKAWIAIVSRGPRLRGNRTECEDKMRAAARSAPVERGVYLDEVSFDMYVSYKVVNSDGLLIRRTCDHVSTVDDSTLLDLWDYLERKDPLKLEATTGHLTLV